MREDSLIAGDFNSNACWNNHFKREFNHDSLVAFLEKNKFFSLYHHFAGCVHGAEKEATIFMYRDEKRPYYIDYVFAHEKVLDKRPVFKIGTYGDWSKYSDHMPLFVEISD